MTKTWKVVLAATVLGLTACEAPDEKPAQADLSAAKDLRAAGKLDVALMALAKLERDHPKTKAAQEAQKVREEVKAQVEKELKERTEKLQKELAEIQAKAKRIAAKIAESQKPLSTLATSKDDMRGWTWYRDLTATQWVLGKYLKLYFGVTGAGDEASLGPLRLQVQYEGEDWIFARTLLIKVGGKVFNLAPDNWKHENSGGTVWESVDLPLSVDNPELLAALVNADEVKVRFEGRNLYSDYVVPKAQLAAAKRVHAVWKPINEAGEAKGSPSSPSVP